MLKAQEEANAEKFAEALLKQDVKAMCDAHLQDLARIIAEILNSQALWGMGEELFIQLQNNVAIELAHRAIKFKWKLNRQLKTPYNWKEKDELREARYFSYEKKRRVK